MKPILEIQNISKKFRINHEKQPYLSLRDRFTNLFKSDTTTEDFWALKDVSYDIMPGDTVGIIGKNGAGKSTLLKILSKITPPTSGKIISRGRIASLLEVGTGFHPELSGRENIFLNGSILGMKRSEIMQKFDDIVEFSGVSKFIDTPLKHYSSGMQLRLAFAVAAFLEPEILIIDEVLAVGDAEFQKKCMGKMNEVSKSGRTILFVSHQFSALMNVCEKGMLLSAGHKIFEGSIKDAVSFYNNNMLAQETHGYFKSNDPKKEVCFIRILSTKNNISSYRFDFTDHIGLNITLAVNLPLKSAKIGFALLNSSNNRVFADYRDLDDYNVTNKEINISIELPASLFSPGMYSLSFGIVIPNGPNIDIVENAFHVEIADDYGNLLNAGSIQYGDVIFKSTWN